MALTEAEKIEFLNGDEVKKVADTVAAVQTAFDKCLQGHLDKDVPMQRLKALATCTTNRLQNEVRTLNDGNGVCNANEHWDETLQRCVPNQSENLS